ncbi:carbohydrate kinase family protein [bacterium]|jgi:sugar/nucleoside kinase (ribokinase family)|nr:carbohydrate kinase family protein [bacterium]MBT4648721.1 carbohydrate kinase family protein [bacterium]
MRKNIVTTIGGATQDIMFYTNDMVLVDNKDDLLRQKLIGFEYGAKVYSEQVYFTFGGGGANAAANFAGLGIKAQTILAVGQDLVGHAILANLQNRKIDTRLVQKHSKYNSGISSIINVGSFNEHVIFAYRGANNHIDLSEKIVRKINTPWVYLTSLAGKSAKSLNVLFAHCQKKNIQVAWNPGSNQLKLGLKKLAKFIQVTDVFDVNRDEALELLVGVNKDKVKNNIRFILKELHKWGQKYTVVTDGPKGAYVYDGKKVYFKAAFKKKGINTTGAGDSFGSGLVAGLIKYHGNIEKALRLGIYNSNSVVMKIGAQEGILTAGDLKKYKL